MINALEKALLSGPGRFRRRMSVFVSADRAKQRTKRIHLVVFTLAFAFAIWPSPSPLLSLSCLTPRWFPPPPPFYSPSVDIDSAARHTTASLLSAKACEAWLALICYPAKHDRALDLSPFISPGLLSLTRTKCLSQPPHFTTEKCCSWPVLGSCGTLGLRRIGHHLGSKVTGILGSDTDLFGTMP